MNLNIWTKDTYKEFLKYLESLQDLKYRDFHKSLLHNDSINLIGIRTPELRKIAKEISKGDYKQFFKLNTMNTYEEKIIYGFVIGYIKSDFNEIKKFLDDFILHIDSWATCDLVCSNLKIFKNNLEDGFIYLKEKINSSNPWIKRFSIVMFLDYYISDNYIDEILEIINNIDSDDYYVEMAIAWFLATLYIDYPNKVLDILNSKKLSKNVVNLTIKKACESYRISIENKNIIKKYKL